MARSVSSRGLPLVLALALARSCLGGNFELLGVDGQVLVEIYVPQSAGTTAMTWGLPAPAWGQGAPAADPMTPTDPVTQAPTDPWAEPEQLPAPTWPGQLPPSPTKAPPIYSPVQQQPPAWYGQLPPCPTKAPPICAPTLPPLQPPPVEKPVPPLPTPMPTCPPPPPPPAKSPSEHRLVWGDPHLKTDDGSSASDQIQAGRDLLLLGTSDGSHIAGHTARYRTKANKYITVFDREAIDLGDGHTRVELDANGEAFLISATGTRLRRVRNGEVFESRTNPADSIRFANGTLTYSLVDGRGNSASGSVQAHKGKGGNYLSTGVDRTSGTLYGMIPSMKSSFKNTKVNARTGAGAFIDNQTNRNFYVSSLE